MNLRPLLLALLASLTAFSPAITAAEPTPNSPPPTPSAYNKTRLLVLTDIANEPDDTMSLVRLMVYANQFDLEGLVATTSVHLNKSTAPEQIRTVVEAYAKVRANLELHEPGYPAAEHLLSLITTGLPLYGMKGVGDGKDSPGSELLIKAIDRDDPRPLWITVWGGPNTLAQALHKLRATRTPEQLAQLLAKLRVYAISDQDDSGPWIRKNFPALFYIVSPGFHSGGGYHRATWSGISGDHFWGRFTGPDFTPVTNEWLDKNIRAKGPLGAEYPQWKFLMEGDTPSYLCLINNGLGDPEHPDWGSWGGRYELYTPRTRKWFLEPETRPIWTDTEDEVQGTDGKWHTGNQETIWRWRTAYQNDFAARMDWTVKPRAEANHPPVVKLAHPATLAAKAGERVTLSAAPSSDPDGDALSYQWFCYDEAGTFTAAVPKNSTPVKIENANQAEAAFTVPTSKVLRYGTLHFIVAVTDTGTPALTRYQRVIIDTAK